MGSIIKKFTIDRNAFLKTVEDSAKMANLVALSVLKKENLLPGADKTLENKIGVLVAYCGLFKKVKGEWQITDIGKTFLRLWEQGDKDAWRWLLTRSLWRLVVPNGMGSLVNKEANGKQFQFFRLILQILLHLSTQQNLGRYFYYDEFFKIFDDDDNWVRDSAALYLEIISERHGQNLEAIVQAKPGILGELEKQYSTGHDTFNTIFQKAFAQTGLFQFYKNAAGKPVGIALRTNLDEVLQERIKFVIDHPLSWNSNEMDWQEFLELQSIDLPQKVTKKDFPTIDDFIETKAIEESVVTELDVIGEDDFPNLVDDVLEAFENAGFRTNDEVIRRFVASLLAKRFVILSGLSGSGKTKLAQLFAAWIDAPGSETLDPFTIGTEISSERSIYKVIYSDKSLVELEPIEGGGTTKIVPLPRKLIDEWVETIKENHFSKDTSAEVVRSAIKENSKYAPFMHGFAGHLKAAAFRTMEMDSFQNSKSRFTVIPVEAGWTSTEDIFGYPDALTPNKFVRRPALDLILSAYSNPTYPYFLILDEMNLSHVERYFAAVLSAIESGEPISLHGDSDERDSVPPQICLPPNLFVIGTINVDETTYMFSPKVLDRANVMEFRISTDLMQTYLDNPKEISKSAIIGKGAGYGRMLVKTAIRSLNLGNGYKTSLANEASLFFNALAQHESEFGFRPAMEIARFVQFHELLTKDKDNWEFKDAWDAQVLQKLMPKIHGSQKKLEPLLRVLAILCYEVRKWSEDKAQNEEERGRISKLVQKAADLRNKDFDPLTAKKKEENAKETLPYSGDMAYLPLSFEKVLRMLRRLQRDGFTSFAEA